MRPLSTLGVVLFVLALLGGIGYSLAVVRWSGAPVASLPHPGGRGEVTTTLVLGPEMNPLRASLDATYRQTLATARLYATTTLHAPDGTVAWTRRVRVSYAESGAGGSTSVSMPVERFAVAARGPHRLTLRLETDHVVEGAIREAEVHVRRNVRVLNPALLGLLTLTGLLGLGLAVLGRAPLPNAV